jgi:hypothetical protein
MRIDRSQGDVSSGELEQSRRPRICSLILQALAGALSGNGLVPMWRESELEDGTPRFIRDGPSLVRLDDRPANGQAHPCSARLRSVGSLEDAIAMGRYQLRENGGEPWQEQLLEELTTFPNGKHDDWVDALSDAFDELVNGKRVDKSISAVW